MDAKYAAPARRLLLREDGRLFAGLPGILSMNSWLFTFFCMAMTDGCTVTLIDWTEWPTIGVLLARSWHDFQPGIC